ncbi:MAG: glycosyltransferase [Chloroflexi bacterium]|nr:glycosyltransferase [Chloroflexota bacterium]
MAAAMTRGHRRIALLDNTTNASYVFAKMLRRRGYDADFIQQPNLPFNQQPVWEDADLARPVADVYDRTPRDAYWRALEKEVGWHKPEWVRRPGVSVRAVCVGIRLPAALARVMPLGVMPFGLPVIVPEVPIIAAASEYDVLVALGPSAGSAYLAGPPYGVITMGWDVFTLPFMTTSRNPVQRARGFLQRAALKRSLAILGMPSMDLGFLRALDLADHLRPFPVPVDVESYDAIEPGSRAEVFGADVAARMEGRIVYFCPSRVSFAEKGQDLLLRAFAQVRARGVPAFLLLLGWGHEAAVASSLISELGLSDDVCLLPTVYSKRRLIRALRLADVAMVQFILGGYGMLAREALACGVPVVSSYDPAQPQPHPADDPAPILSASTVDAIRDRMLALTDAGARRRAAAQGREWAMRNHVEAPLAQLDRLLSEAG